MGSTQYWGDAFRRIKITEIAKYRSLKWQWAGHMFSNVDRRRQLKIFEISPIWSGNWTHQIMKKKTLDIEKWSKCSIIRIFFVIACHLKQMKWRKRKSRFSKVVYLTMIITLRVAQSWYTSILFIIFKLDFCCSVILCDGAIKWFIHQYSNTLSWYICTMWIID